jgi:hypothetical protein
VYQPCQAALFNDRHLSLILDQQAHKRGRKNVPKDKSCDVSKLFAI